MIQLISNIIICMGIIFICFGLLGVFRFHNFYSRVLVTSNVDTVGFITVMIGVMLKQGISFFSLKVLLILIIVLVMNPLTSHSIARSAYFSGYKIKKEE